jgi:HEAT repeat protein
VLVFLQRTAPGGELATHGLAAAVRFVSIQESGERFALDARNREAFAAAVRAYSGLAGRPADDRLDVLRRITVELLGSPQPEIAASALRDLVIARDLPLVTRDDLPVLEPLLGNAQTPIGVRIGLLAELERRKLVDGPPRWAALVRTARGDDRIAAVRAAGAHPSDAVAAELAPLLGSPDPQLVAAAAMALGTPGRETAVPRLAPLLGSPDTRVRAAAIRGLGRVGTASAGEALAKAAASHPDPSTRRHARAELQGIERSRPQ